jgi:hypothetical protein
MITLLNQNTTLIKNLKIFKMQNFKSLNQNTISIEKKLRISKYRSSNHLIKFDYK